MGDIWKLLIRFRGYRNALISYISKIYHSLKTGMLEKHLRKVVWQHGKQGAVWKVYTFVVVAFGDKIAAVLIQITIRLMVEMYKSIEPVASHKMLNDMFVDDLVTEGEMPEVLRCMGNGTRPLGSVTAPWPGSWRREAYMSKQCRGVGRETMNICS